MEGATYRGKHSSEFGLAVRTNPGLMPDFDNNLIDDIPGMSGAYYVNSEYGTRPIILEVGFLADDYQDYTQRLRKLADWLRPDEGPGAYVADHEPDKTYYAVLESAEMERVENIARMGEGSIELVCPDPFACGEEQSQFIAETVSIANEGTAESYPVFELEVTEEMELIKITNNNHTDDSDNPLSVRIGTETDIDDEKEDKKRLVLHDTMQSTSDWTEGSEVDSGYVTGTMKTDDDGFYVDDYGEDDDQEPESGWIGPALKREFDDTLESFVAEIDIENENYKNKDGDKIPSGVGIIEVYFLDVNDTKVAKVAFGDSSGNESKNSFAFETSGKKVSKGGVTPDSLNDFDGRLRVNRDTGYYYPEFTKVTPNGSANWWAGPGRVIPLEDGGDRTGEHEVKSIQVAIRKWKGSSRIWQRINEIKVWSTIGMYEYPDDKVVVEKFDKGDTVTIDTGKGLVMVNGEERTDLIQMDSDMFTLVEGMNKLEFSDNVKGKVTYRERYL